MEKAQAVASLGMASLLQPARLQAALKANDRLKLYLSLLQSAASHARQPQAAPLDLSREIAAAGMGNTEDANWLRNLPGSASLQGDSLYVPGLSRLAERLRDDLGHMARPLQEQSGDAAASLNARARHWQDYLDKLKNQPEPLLDADTLAALSHGQRERGDSLHITVMDLHKALNRLAAQLATDNIAGAHAWQLAADGSDVPRIEAFMRGLARTRALKGDHPGLDTAATRDGNVLMLQNDIGTNDAHVLVIQVDTGGARPVITLTYSDLHETRFAFFQGLLREVGAHWSDAQARQTAGLNAGDAYYVGTARFEAQDEAELALQLEGIGERIVFLIDWNRARKRLRVFVSKKNAIQILQAAAQRRAGHYFWLEAGSAQLVWNAMAAQAGGVFQLGDQLADVLGEPETVDFLTEVLALATRRALAKSPASLLDDEVRILLTRRLRGHRNELELLQEHAALCHALAQALADALAHGAERDPAAIAQLVARAKGWEHTADQLVVQARTQTLRQPHLHSQSITPLLERSDDVADALEEACFVLGLLAEHFHATANANPPAQWNTALREVLASLAGTVLNAVQDHIKALTIASILDEASEAEDHDEFLTISWRLLQAERRCDELLRQSRRLLAQQGRQHNDAVALTLSNDFAAAVERASDILLVLGHGLRERVLRQLQPVA